ncbi:hypothetical protein ACSU1N_01420 [Thermogladius sp. 4427co]|uniref:hypothetical protein n=1 Tax=Thermogladius sp. 4427co TaxID=3450718 RepID=UPI003F79EE85
MGLSVVSQVFSGVANALSGAGGAGAILFFIGLSIILVIALSLLVIGLVRLIKALPNMSVSGFLKLMIVTASVLIVLGLILP